MNICTKTFLLFLFAVVLISCSKTAISDFKIKNNYSETVTIHYTSVYDTVINEMILLPGVDTLMYTLSIEVGKDAPDSDFEREYTLKILSVVDTSGNSVVKNLNKYTEWEYVRENNRNIYTLVIDPTDW
jgi:hypothetical protein